MAVTGVDVEAIGVSRNLAAVALNCRGEETKIKIVPCRWDLHTHAWAVVEVITRGTLCLRHLAAAHGVLHFWLALSALTEYSTGSRHLPDSPE